MARPTRLGSPEGALRARAGAGASVSTCRPVRQRLLGLRAPCAASGGGWGLAFGWTNSLENDVCPANKTSRWGPALCVYFSLFTVTVFRLRCNFLFVPQRPGSPTAASRWCALGVQVGGGGRGCGCCRWNVGERRRPTCPGDKVAPGGQCGDQTAPGPGGPPSYPRGGWGRPGLSAGEFQGRRSGLQAGRGGSAPTPGLRVLGGSAELPRFSCRV